MWTISTGSTAGSKAASWSGSSLTGSSNCLAITPCWSCRAIGRGPRFPELAGALYFVLEGRSPLLPASAPLELFARGLVDLPDLHA